MLVQLNFASKDNVENYRAHVLGKLITTKFEKGCRSKIFNCKSKEVINVFKSLKINISRASFFLSKLKIYFKIFIYHF